MTDNTKTLAKKHNTTIAFIRDIAREAGLEVNYSTRRRCWFIDERPAVVNQFNRQLDEVLAVTTR